MAKSKTKPRKKPSPKSNVKRNRKERLGSQVYRAVKLFHDDDDDKDTLLIDGEAHIIEGEIGQWVVLSVPTVSVSMAAMEELKAKAQLALNRPVIVLTHNVDFMVLHKLPPKEAAAVIKRAEDRIHAEEESRTARNESPGDSPGVGEDGSSADSGEAEEAGADSVADGGDQAGVEEEAGQEAGS